MGNDNPIRRDGSMRIGQNIVLRVMGISNSQVKIDIQAPPNVRIVCVEGPVRDDGTGSETNRE
jgi:hypothetical protein